MSDSGEETANAAKYLLSSHSMRALRNARPAGELPKSLGSGEDSAYAARASASLIFVDHMRKKTGLRCGCSAERRAAVKEHRGAHLYCWGIEEVTRFFSVISNPDNAVSLHSVALFFWSYPFFSLWQFPTLFRFPIIPLLYHFYTIFIPFFPVCRFRVCAAALRLFLCSVKPDGEHSHCHLRRRRR
jgi:hypothetical protein